MIALESLSATWAVVALRISLGIAAGSLLVGLWLRVFPGTSPATRHRLWALVLLQGLLWFQVPIWVAAANPIIGDVDSAPSSNATHLMNREGESGTRDVPRHRIATATVASPRPLERTSVVSRAESASRWSWTPVFLTWLSLVGLIAAWLVLRYWLFSRCMLGSAVPAEETIHMACREQAQRLGFRGTIRVVQSSLVEVPMLAALPRPTIVLPESLSELPPDQRDAVLAHELAHMLRRDWTWAILATAACVLNFFNPLAWRAGRRLQLAREVCVDQLVTGKAGHTPATYSRALFRIAELVTSKRQALGLAAGSRVSELRWRIERILSPPKAAKPRRLSAQAMCAAMAAGIVLSLLSVRERPAQADDRDKTPGKAAAADAKVKQAKLPLDVQKAVDRALDYLAARQLDDGSFAKEGYGRNVGVVGLAGLAFLYSGSTPDRGPHAKTIRRAIAYLLARVDEKGLIVGGAKARSHGPMYGHAFATLFLAKCFTVSGAETKKKITPELAKAVKLIVDSQNGEGGWRYLPDKTQGADASVTSCQIAALAAARRAEVAVPKKTLDRATAYLRKCQNADGGFRYTTHGGASAFPRSAGAVAGLYYGGLGDSAEVKRGLPYVKGFIPRGEAKSLGHYFYGHYYAAHAMWFAGGETRKSWNQAISDELISAQRDDGSWNDAISPIYGTAMACIILQVPKAQPRPKK